MRNFKGNPDLALEFEYLLRLGHKRKDTDKIPVLFENLTPTKLMVQMFLDAKFSGESRSDVRM